MPFLPFPDEPTVPVLAEQTQPTWVEVVFSRDVVLDAEADPSIWTVTNGSGAVVSAVTQIGPARLLLVLSAGAACTAVSYAPPPFDVVDVLGVDVDGFADFAIT